ncbi:hypothetical protein RJD39_03950 [Vibrio scophthalmi]|uniref:hypothetical protein n=1 Tax=Vibrio scophthalmi TaxID=45658 RepID=UPI003872F7C4
MEDFRIKDLEYLRQYIAGEFDPLDRENFMAIRHMANARLINRIVDVLDEILPEELMDLVAEKVVKSEEYRDFKQLDKTKSNLVKRSEAKRTLRLMRERSTAVKRETRELESEIDKLSEIH